MKLSEKIYTLRTERGLSQGDLAEKLDVSRQSVSKWETGQSVPDLDKIIKLADLFGVTTDHLLRETEALPPQPEPQILYVERKYANRTAGHFIGILMICLGGGIFLVGLLGRTIELLMLGLTLLIGGIPMIIKRRFHWSVPLWMMATITLFQNLFFATVLGIITLGLMYYADEEEGGP